MEDLSGDTIMEEREELMVPPTATGGEPTLRTAHFLKPTLASASFPLPSNIIRHESTKQPLILNVIYREWKRPHRRWVEWVNRLKPLYGHVWKKAGIFDAIMASTCHIVRDKVHEDFIMKLAEKWCPETNTFIFSWGEATITLEDIVVLGGYSVLGEFVLRNPVETDEILGLEEKLRRAHLSITRTTGQAAKESAWLRCFIEGGAQKSEHEGFLVWWLSRYVFPKNYPIVAKDLFLIAINLSRGVPYAIAPAVLASLYRDLGLLKESLLALSNHETGKCASKNTKLTLCSPLGLVQIWAWERFPTLSPEPNPIELGEPRLARWQGLKQLEFLDFRKALDSAGEYFQWRPYAPILRNWDHKKLYKESEQYIIVGPGIDSEVETLVRCWRSSELVGIDCMEQYLPHRVGMQFGFDQDLPGFVKRLNSHTAGFAWSHYNRPLRDAKLYIPARLFESDTTKRYQEQWRAQLKLGKEINAPGNDTLPPEMKQNIQGKSGGVEKESEIESVLSSAKNDDPNPVESDGEKSPTPTENASAMKGKERLASCKHGGEQSEPKIETYGTFAGKDCLNEVITETSEQKAKELPERQTMATEMENLESRIRNLEKIVGHLSKKSCKKERS